MADNKKNPAVKKKTTNTTKNKEVKSNTKKVSTKKSVAKTIKQEPKKETTSKKNTTSTKPKPNKKKVPKFSTVSNIKIETTNEGSVLKTETKQEKVTFKSKISAWLKKNIKKISVETNAKVDKKLKKEKKNQKTEKKPKTEKKESKIKKFFSTINTKKCFIGIVVLCVMILILEGIFLIVHKVNIDKKTTYYDTMNSVTIDDTDIIAVGSSDFRYSKSYSYTKGLEKGKLIKYDKKGEIIFEKMYENGINTTFSSVITVSDGYIVVGSGVFSEEEQEKEAKEAMIIKYDKEGNIIWEKFYHVLTNTKFNKVIEIEDGYIAIGQSIYANMEMGSHTTGGGIIVKYDKEGNEVWHNNHGGTKSGNFYDVVEVNGDLYIAGKDGADSGNIVKFNKNGEYQWHKNYSYTDGIGLTGIAYLDNMLYVVGSKKILDEKAAEENNTNTTNTDAILIAYDMNGTKKFEKTFGGSNYERYNAIITYRNELYVVGHTSSKDAGFKIETDGETMTGLVIRYDKDGNILKKEVYGGSKDDNLTDIITDGVCLYISGYSNSDDGNIKTSKDNGKDYFGKIIELDLKFRTLMIK